MRVLDLDLDYFLNSPVYEIDYDSVARITDEMCIESVWSEERVRNFLEQNLKLSKNRKVEGRILIGHDEALYFWDELIDSHRLIAPFSVVHIDSHADLSYGDTTKSFILNNLIFWKQDIRSPRFCKDCEYDGHFYNIGIGNYLLYAIAFGWISDLTYCANPEGEMGDIPQEILTKQIPDRLSKPYNSCIRLRPTEPYPETEIPQEIPVPLHIIPKIEYVQTDANSDFLSIAQSPNYTPESADYILDIVREYIQEI